MIYYLEQLQSKFPVMPVPHTKNQAIPNGKQRENIKSDKLSDQWTMNSNTAFFRILAGFIVAAIAVAVTVNPTRGFITVDEIAHLPAGVEHWRFQRFAMYRVNPPLVRMVASIPVVISGVEFDWDGYTADIGSRPEFVVGLAKLKSDKLAISSIYFLPRCIVFGIILLLIAIFAASVYFFIGKVAASVCCLYLVTCSELFAHGFTIGPDFPGAILHALTGIMFAAFFVTRSNRILMMCGTLLGITLLAKLTYVSSVLVLPLTTSLLILVHEGRLSVIQSVWQAICRVLTVLFIALILINVGYLFEDSFARLGSFRFCSELLGGEGSYFADPKNRFDKTAVANFPIPLPKNYVLGVDYLRMEVEQKKWSFLDGEWRFGSWPHYYIMTTIYKTPEPTLLAAALGFVVFVVGWSRGLAKPELVSMVLLLTIPAAVCFMSVSCQGGFNHHHRYVLMIYPPMFVFASLLASPLARQVFSRRPFSVLHDVLEDNLHRSAFHDCRQKSVRSICLGFARRLSKRHWTQWLAFVLLALSIASTLRVHPYYTSYFNSLSGGPENGWRLLGFSNIDWGQDILEVDQWLKAHPDRRPLVMDIDYFGMNGKLFDVPTTDPPQLPKGASIDEVRRSITETQWWIISVKKLYNLPDQPGLEYLQQLDPVDKIAYAYHVYRIDPLPSDSR